jgi:hypothetical protein
MIILVLFFNSVTVLAKQKLPVEYSAILNNCSSLTHSQWIKKYSDLEDQIVEALEKNGKLSQGKDKEFFEVLFPQDLPKSHPMKGAFIGCIEIFGEYQSAINNVQSMSALKRLEACYQDAYRSTPPKVLGKYMDCLKRIKY